MHIERVRLKNIRNYTDTELFFHTGVNFIKGKNGAGKSTLIESVGYALFNLGESGVTDYFLTYGADEGLIEVDFTGPGGRYTVTRRIIRKNARNVWSIRERDFDRPAELYRDAEKKQFLAEAMGLSRDWDIASLFRDVIGVRQGEFREPFEKAPEERKRYFNRIFGVEDYNRAHEMLAQAVGELHLRRELSLKDREYLEQEASGLEAAAKRRDKLQKEREESRKRLSRLERKADENSRKREKQARLKERKTSLEKEMLSAQAMCESLKKQAEEKEKQIASSRQAGEIMRRHEQGYLAYGALKKRSDELAQQSRDRQALSARMGETESALSRLAGELESTEKSLAECAARNEKERASVAMELEKARADAQAGAAGAQEALAQEALLEQLSASGARQDDYVAKGRAFVRDTLLVKSTQCGGIEKNLGDARDAIAARAESAKMEALLEDEKRRDAEMAAQEAALADRAASIQRYAEALASGRCPFFHIDCEPARQKGKQGVERELADAERQLRELREARAALGSRIRALQAHAGATAEIRAAQARVDRLEEERRQCEKELAALAAKPLSWDMARHAQALAVQYRSVTGQAMDTAAVVEAFSAYKQASGEGSLDAAQRYKEALEAFAAFLETLRSGAQQRLIRQKALCAQKQAETASAASQEQRLVSHAQQLADEEARIIIDKKTLGKKRAAREAAAKELESLQAEAKKYAGLDGEVRSVQKEMSGREEDFRRYIECRPEAEKLTGLLEEAGQTALLVQKTEREVEAKALSLGRIAYDAEEEARLTAQASEVSRMAGEESGRLTHLEKELEQAGKEEERAAQAAEKLAGCQRTLQRIDGAETILRSTRTALKTAGPRVAGIYRRRVQARADGIYRSVSREGASLLWTDSYELELRDIFKGQERRRVFRQLSGGEKMTAALAVRLGLLEAFSGAGIGFFDEPTDNMDAVRRQNLADILAAQCAGFAQVFVVSHDDTFDRITDNVVYLGGAE